MEYLNDIINIALCFTPLIATFVARENFKLMGTEMLDKNGKTFWSCHFYSHSFELH